MTVNSHHRFTKGKPHLTNLIAFCEELKASVDGGGGGENALKDISFNFSRAFDKVSYSILVAIFVAKLEKDGLDV